MKIGDEKKPRAIHTCDQREEDNKNRRRKETTCYKIRVINERKTTRTGDEKKPRANEYRIYWPIKETGCR